MLRSCYTTKARLFRGSPTETDIVWYFTDRDFLPYPNSYHSLNWDRDRFGPVDDGGPGEVPGRRRPWRNGEWPGSAPLPDSVEPLGSASDFLLGCSPRATPREQYVGGACSCCVDSAAFSITPEVLNTDISGFFLADGSPAPFSGPVSMPRDLSATPDPDVWTIQLGVWTFRWEWTSFNTYFFVDGTYGGVVYHVKFTGSSGIFKNPPDWVSIVPDPGDLEGFTSVPSLMTVTQGAHCRSETSVELTTEDGDPILTEGGDVLET